MTAPCGAPRTSTLEAALAGVRAGSDLHRTLVAHQHLWGNRARAFRAASTR